MSTFRRGTPEGALQKAILQYLQAKGILAFRMQVGAMAGEYNGKRRFMRFGTVGMADILAFPYAARPLWIEVKTATGKQSEFQKSFQAQVEAQGHRYVVARSVEDVMGILGV